MVTSTMVVKAILISYFKTTSENFTATQLQGPIHIFAVTIKVPYLKISLMGDGQS